MALARDNVTLPTGTVKSGLDDLYVRSLGEYRSLGEIERTVVATPGGRPVRVRDLGRVRDGYEDVGYLVEMNGVPAISLGIQKQSGGNTVAVARARSATPFSSAIRPTKTMRRFFSASTRRAARWGRAS